MQGVIDEEHIEVAVLIIIEKCCLGGVSFVGQPVFRSFFGKAEIAVIDEEQVPSPGRIPVRRAADINIHFAVAVDIHHGRAGAPAFLRGNAALLRDVFKPGIAFIEEETVVHHIAGEQDIGQPIVIDVPDGHAARHYRNRYSSGHSAALRRRGYCGS